VKTTKRLEEWKQNLCQRTLWKQDKRLKTELFTVYVSYVYICTAPFYNMQTLRKEHSSFCHHQSTKGWRNARLCEMGRLTFFLQVWDILTATDARPGQLSILIVRLRCSEIIYTKKMALQDLLSLPQNRDRETQLCEKNGDTCTCTKIIKQQDDKTSEIQWNF